MSTAIYLLDQTHRQLDLAQGASAKVRDACEAMGRALGLIDSERVAQYFAIVANVDGKRREIIIPEQDSVSHWAPRCHKLFFRILTFVEGVLHSRDPGILNLRYIQAVHDVLSGRLSVPEHLVEHLAALQLQKRYGPYNKGVHKSGFVVDHMLELVPRSALPLRKPSRWESDIFAAYEGLSGRRIDPSAEFLNLLEGLKRYGEHRFSADRGNSPSGAHGALIASRRGISFEPTDESWEWTEIASWSMKSNNPQWIAFDLLRPEADASSDGPSDDDNNEGSVEFLCTDEDATDLAIICWKYAQVLASASRPLVDVASPPTTQRRNLVSYESDGSISTLRAQPGSSFKSAANRSTQSDDEDNRGQSDDNQDEQSDDDLGEQGDDNHAEQDNENQGEQSVDDHAEQHNDDHSEHASGVGTDRSVQNNTNENVGSKDADDTAEKKESDSRRSGNVADDTTSHRTTSKELISDDEKSSDHGQALNKDEQDADPDRGPLTEDNNNNEHGESERPDDSEESLRERAAVLLQAHARGVLQRIRIDAELAAMEEEAREVGAVRIQAAYRGYAARRAFDEMEEEFAAIFIQAHVRRFLVRCKTSLNIGAVSDESLPSIATGISSRIATGISSSIATGISCWVSARITAAGFSSSSRIGTTPAWSGFHIFITGAATRESASAASTASRVRYASHRVPLPPRVAPPGLALYGADEDESEDDDDNDEDTRGDNDNKNTSKQVENAQATEPRVPAPRPPSVPPPSNTQPFIPPQPPRALPPNAPDDGEYSV
ncbi:Moesin/ezrin/radixin-like 1 [Hondaea fermentalgiana]|uniref:Moesin/ezrin/radixin-like 1 n=1 Tax=Hondaea fermentalgiana TaxID=2315210 RepID=A0A2R5G041_9STRA|nr:Moesin/ezrin/radixin-like 1 [Hondaea fermentalgiana]|eukprot:GBG24360.1 Moesin/ezrin/radixin-like 1 [Hondaea fermentalgiana]